MPESIYSAYSLSDDEFAAVYGACHGFLRYLPHIAPERKALASAFEKMHAAVRPEHRPTLEADLLVGKDPFAVLP